MSRLSRPVERAVAGRILFSSLAQKERPEAFGAWQALLEQDPSLTAEVYDLPSMVDWWLDP